jgi:hypothetical protein
MADFTLPGHVVSQRRDGRQEVLLHRSVAIISPEKIEIRSARSTVVLPLIGLGLAAVAIYFMGPGPRLPIWAMAGLLLFCLLVVPVSVMAIISSVAGADVIIDAKKQSATWQQGYLGMGIGTKELVPFWSIDHLEVTVEGEEPDRWRGHQDALRQFALVVVKKSGKRLNLAQVPVPAYGQEDGMDRTLAVGQAVAALTGSRVEIPEGWELVEVDAETLAPAAPAPQTARDTPGRRPRKRGKRGRSR